MEKKNDKQNNRNNKNNIPNKTMIIVTLISAIFIWYLFSFVQNQIHESTNIEKTYDEFITMLENEKLKKVVVR